MEKFKLILKEKDYLIKSAIKKLKIYKNYEDLLVSVVIPLLNEEESLPELSAALERELSVIAPNKWEVIFIDDGSTDNSFGIIKEINSKNKRFKFRSNDKKSI